MASFSLSAYPQNSTATASGGPQNTPTAGGVSPTDAPPVPLVSRFVVRFSHPRSYLHSYLDAEGILATPDIREAKLFPNFTIARRIANLFYGEPARVICTLDGRDIRAALIETIFTTVLEGGATEGEQTTTSVGKVRGASGEEAPRAAFVATDLFARPASDGRKLLFNFLSDFLNVPVFGIQPGFKQHPDCYLFQGPHGSTLAVPTSVMLLDRESALAIVQKKIAEKIKAFGDGQ
jgi:hypothetical protein